MVASSATLGFVERNVLGNLKHFLFGKGRGVGLFTILAKAPYQALAKFLHPKTEKQDCGTTAKTAC
jgi:hypothetical protein